MNILAFSGGKDSTAMTLRLAELGEDFTLLFTPTGDELPECEAHIFDVAKMVNRKLEIRKHKLDLFGLIEKYDSLPNNRQRWCTRQLKIEVCQAFLLEHTGSTLMVGLRADEEERQGMYGEYAKYRFPLREWCWGIDDVYSYLDDQNIRVPERTDCGACYDQRLSDWWKPWKRHPDRWARYEALEAKTGHTFRSPSRDTWPASLTLLRVRFEKGDMPRGMTALPLFNDADTSRRCRVCSM